VEPPQRLCGGAARPSLRALSPTTEFTLECPHGVTEAETTNRYDDKVLVYAGAYHTLRQACQCAERLFERLSGTSRRAERRV
jgi:hypothetical protein